jgi:hypothetical protein
MSESRAFEDADRELREWMRKRAFPKAYIQSIATEAHRLYTAALAELQARVMELELERARIREALVKIVIPDGEDAGVILLSDESPTDWIEEHQCHVYRHAYFSPLGDALVALAKSLEST